ncbi:hypothetical protein AVEN_73123-1 [Araneus ventricosus]|uniref:Uncharacterized protein n=1 Tax=Araneus ventricosus TaxID=182803 RepID=A0A4Y2RR39_ARAVE|nr:hypothetical protein AVEN_73123-1 [Araneus ventricosus]
MSRGTTSPVDDLDNPHSRYNRVRRPLPPHGRRRRSVDQATETVPQRPAHARGGGEPTATGGGNFLTSDLLRPQPGRCTPSRKREEEMVYSPMMVSQGWPGTRS